MTDERFTTKNGVFYTDNETGWEFQSYGEVVALLNELNRLAVGNEEQLLKVMRYLHDNYYDVWEEVNKRCFE